MPQFPKSALNIARAQCQSLGPQPSSVAYYDPFSETMQTLTAADKSNVFRIKVRGQDLDLRLDDVPSETRELHRRAVLWALTRYSPSTVLMLHQGLVRVCNGLGQEPLLAPFVLNPVELKNYWEDTILPWLVGMPVAARPMKQYLSFLCHFGMGCLSDERAADLIRSFRGPAEDLYASVRDGDVFLTPGEEIAIISHLDALAFSIERGEPVTPQDVTNACVLICAYEHAMRPIQISKVVADDVRLRNFPAFQTGVSVHVRFHMEKQSSPDQKLPMLRRIKPEWSPIFVTFEHTRTSSRSGSYGWDALNESYFGMGPTGVSLCIREFSKAILGYSRSANAYRHSAAQRLVDAGASHEELAEFLGHSGTRTANVYFTSSAHTVDRLNKALAASPIYSPIPNLHRNKSIEPRALERRPPDHQVGGAPHGFPIKGIGDCDLGQSLCPKNPVLGCYGCIKFIPVRDVKKHEQVRDALRPVVRRFYEASKGETPSPAYLQLRNTIAIVEEVISDQSENKSGKEGGDIHDPKREI